MKPFPDPLEFQAAGFHNGSMLLRMSNRFRYFSSFGQVTVPKHFVTDGASIPRMFWAILSPFGDYFAPALIHDFLYSPLNTEFTREEADLIFLEAMFNVGVPWHRRHLIHAAVRLFGWASYKNR